MQDAPPRHSDPTQSFASIWPLAWMSAPRNSRVATFLVARALDTWNRTPLRKIDFIPEVSVITISIIAASSILKQAPRKIAFWMPPLDSRRNEWWRIRVLILSEELNLEDTCRHPPSFPPAFSVPSVPVKSAQKSKLLCWRSLLPVPTRRRAPSSMNMPPSKALLVEATRIRLPLIVTRPDLRNGSKAFLSPLPPPVDFCSI